MSSSLVVCPRIDVLVPLIDCLVVAGEELVGDRGRLAAIEPMKG